MVAEDSLMAISDQLAGNGNGIEREPLPAMARVQVKRRKRKSPKGRKSPSQSAVSCDL